MVKRTKKVKSTGRYGVRYGLKIRKKLIDVEKEGKKYPCPLCLKPKLKRVASGIWECKSCRVKIAGDAYTP